MYLLYNCFFFLKINIIYVFFIYFLFSFILILSNSAFFQLILIFVMMKRKFYCQNIFYSSFKVLLKYEKKSILINNFDFY